MSLRVASIVFSTLRYLAPLHSFFDGAFTIASLLGLLSFTLKGHGEPIYRHILDA